jgi:CBS domain-containing protein
LFHVSVAVIPSFPNDGTPELISFLRAAVIPDPLVVTPHTSVPEAAALMARARPQPASDSLIPDQASLNQQARSGCVVVLDPDRGVLGSFSTCDLVALAATAPSLHALSMAEVMIQPVLHLTESDSIGLVERLRDLRQGGRRYLPAVDGHGMLLGYSTSTRGRWPARRLPRRRTGSGPTGRSLLPNIVG